MRVQEEKQTARPASSKAWANFIALAVVLFLLAAMAIFIFKPNLKIPEPGVVRALRAIGSAELAYQSSNNMKDWGTLQALQLHTDLPKGVRSSEMVPGYSIYLSVLNNKPPVLGGFDGTYKFFTVIAYPHASRRFGALSTFGLADDLIVRRYNPKKGNIAGSMHTWDPVL
jgi:hypothetical protein